MMQSLQARYHSQRHLHTGEGSLKYFRLNKQLTSVNRIKKRGRHSNCLLSWSMWGGGSSSSSKAAELPGMNSDASPASEHIGGASQRCHIEHA
jgi:hypothetical protein